MADEAPRVVHCKVEPFDVYIGRPSKWGNPYRMKDRSEAERERVLQQYRMWVTSNPSFVAEIKRELRGKVLGCYCAPLACHGDILLRIANLDD